MTNTSTTLETPAQTPETLPIHWPDRREVAVTRPWWIPWPMAILLMPLFWLLPKRMGPHFAAVRWPAVVIAHVITLTYGVGLIAMTDYGSGEWLESLNRPSAIVPINSSEPGTDLVDLFWSPIAKLVISVGPGINEFEDFLILAAIVGVFEVGIVAIALMQIAYAAKGEKRRHAFARCLKLTYWCSTSFILLGFGILISSTPEIFPMPPTPSTAVPFFCGLFLIYLVWLWLRSTARFPGPAEGPGFEPLSPLCEQCGYGLTGLTAEHNCPECGKPVSESLPDCRQPLPPLKWTRPIQLVRDFARLWYKMIFTRKPCSTLQLQSDHQSTRRFAVLCGLCTAALLTIVFWTASPAISPNGFQEFLNEFNVNLHDEEEVFSFGIITFGCALWLAFISAALPTFITGLYSRRYNPRVNAARLHAALWGPACAIAIIGFWLFIEWDPYDLYEWWIGKRGPAAIIAALMAVGTFTVMVGGAPLFAVSRMLKSIRHARYANA